MHAEFSQLNTDGACWRCSQCKSKLSIRYNSWTYVSSLSLRQLVKLLGYWCDQRTVKDTVQDLNIATPNVVKKFALFREIAKIYTKDIANRPFSGPQPV